MAGSAVDKFKGSLSIWAGTVTVQIGGWDPVQMGAVSHAGLKVVEVAGAHRDMIVEPFVIFPTQPVH
jgi:hypothetical protein